MITKKINPTFKILSMFGIIFVVAGHVSSSSFSLLFDWFPPYSFHLALFTFVSGYFFKEKDLDHFKDFIRKKVKNLLFPFFIWTFLYGLVATLLHYFGFSMGESIGFKSFFISSILDGHQFVYNLASWYVIPLFFIQIINFIIRKFFRKIGYTNEYKITFLYLIAGMVGITMVYNGHDTGIYILLFRILFLLPCFQFGIVYKRCLEEKDTMKSFPYFGIVFLVQAVLLLLFNNLNYTVAWGNDFINGPIVPYLSAITGIAFWLRISKLLTPLLEKQKWMYEIANNTSSIMIHHVFSFFLCKTFLALLAKMTPFLSSFDMYAYKNDIWYYYYPNNISAFGFLYVLGAIFISLGIKKGTDFLWYEGKKKYKQIRNKLYI